MIERKAWLRSDDALIDSYLHSDQHRLLIWFDGQWLLASEVAPWFYFPELQQSGVALSAPVYLGQHCQHHYFCCQLEQWHGYFDASQLHTLRAACHLFNDFWLSLFFHAQGMIHWHRHHAFCPACGSPTRVFEAGHARRCINSDCARPQYPKLDPAVIFSIENKNGAESRLLLGRKKQWDEYRYSVVAGFVEPGETLEDAVRREAYEETGLKVAHVEYLASQPWPFPDALMLGFHCETSDEVITLVDQELDSARWFSAIEIEHDLQGGNFKMPFAFSIAWHLINRWFQQQTGHALKASR